MSIIGNIGGQSGGGSLTKSILIVTAPTGSTVTVTKGATTKAATEKNGEWWFKNLENGEWTIRATLGGQNAMETYNISQFGVYRKAISYRMTPEFTYAGDYEIVQDDDTPIADFASWKGNWKIRLLTSGDFRITKMHGFTGKIDVFSVGGGGRGGNGSGDSAGGGGGGGGYTANHKGARIEEGVKYPIVIGASDSPTTGFGQTAEGGKPGGHASAGPIVGAGGGGGSGGGSNGPGGQDGADGSGAKGGKGQGTTTREFGQPEGRIYATGGKGYPNPNEHRDGPANSGDGGSGQYQPPAAGVGGSGIVIIRNAREVSQ